MCFFMCSFRRERAETETTAPSTLAPHQFHLPCAHYITHAFLICIFNRCYFFFILVIIINVRNGVCLSLFLCQPSFSHSIASFSLNTILVHRSLHLIFAFSLQCCSLKFRSRFLLVFSAFAFSLCFVFVQFSTAI